MVVQTVPYKHAVVSHRAGTTVPSARLIGKGSVEVLSGSAGGSGMAAAGTWSKPHLNQLTDYFDKQRVPDGVPARPDVGHLRAKGHPGQHLGGTMMSNPRSATGGVTPQPPGRTPRSAGGRASGTTSREGGNEMRSRA